MEQQPAAPLAPQPQTPSKKPLFIWGGIGLALLLGLVAWLVLSGSLGPKNAQPVDSMVEFSAGNESQPHTYAGSKVHDACNLVALDTIKSVVPGYNDGLKTLGTDKHPPKQYSITHIYTDRNITAPIKPDDAPRQHQTTVTPDSINTTESIAAYLSPYDSQCAYRQGESVFLKVFVTQPPTPISPQLLAYAAAKPAAQVQTFGEVTLYKDERVGAGPFTGLLLTSAKTHAVTLQTATEELFTAGAAEIAGKLQKEPVGAFTLQYPKPYQALSNPCAIFSADDFAHFNQQTPRATAEEKLVVTKSSNDPFLERGCERIGVPAQAEDIATSSIYIVQFPTVARAEEYIAGESSPDLQEINSMKPTTQQLGDGSFTSLNERDRTGYVAKVRVGAAIVVIRNEPDKKKDASQENFEKCIMPIAQTVVEAYMAQLPK